MTSLRRNPLASYAGRLFDDFPALSEGGRLLRRADARRRLAELDEAEEAVRRQEEACGQVADRLERMEAERRLNLEYLLQFGVPAVERARFRSILAAIARHGGLSLSEAADLARAQPDQRNGPASSFGAGVSAPAATSGDRLSATGGD